MSEKQATSGSVGSTTKTTSRSKFKLFLFVLPVLFGWYIVLQRRILPSSSSLPKQYAICSSTKSGPSIYTLDLNNSIVECILVKNGIISGTSTMKELKEKTGDGIGLKIIKIRPGQSILPGLIDAHAHVLQHGELVASVDLVGATSISEICDRIAKFIELDPILLADRAKLILGGGWDQTKWGNGDFPTSFDLEQDSRLKGRPIVLKRIDVHALWTSLTIMNQMGELPKIVDGGMIIRNKEGLPTGVFLDNAMDFVVKILPGWTDEQRLTYLKSTARKMLTHGLTSVHDAMLSIEDIEFLKKLDQAGRLPIRIYGMISCKPINTFCDVERYDGDRFQLRAVKIFSDGALGSFGAAMIDDYSDNPGERGILISDEAKFKPLMKQWIEKGFQVNAHAIGDRANAIMLDAFEQSLPVNVDPITLDLRLRLEHAQIMTIPDISRASRLGVIASVQPTHATSDMSYAEKRLGPERIKGAYAWKSLVNNGTRIAFGSDFPVEEVNPFLGIHAAIHRTDLNGNSPHGPEGWYPNESLSLIQTLRAFTIDAAFAGFQENRVGSLEVGKEADFILIDRDLFQSEESKKLVAKTIVIGTVVGGKIMFGKIG